MKTTTSAKFTVAELARMMGKPAKEVLFLLQGIGVDVKSVESILDPTTAQAILTGKTQAPKSLIVRQTTATATPAVAAAVAPKPKPERAALKRIKIVEKPPDAPATEAGPAEELEGVAPEGMAVAPTVEAEVPSAAEPVAATVAAPPEPLESEEPASAGVAAHVEAPAAPAPREVSEAPEPAVEPRALATTAAAEPPPPDTAVVAEPVSAVPEAPVAHPASAAAEAPASPEPVPAVEAAVAATPAPPPVAAAAPPAAAHAAPHAPAVRAAAARPVPHAGAPAAARPAAQKPLSASGTVRRAVPAGAAATARPPLRATPPPPPAPPKPALPGGALGRLLKRVGEVPKPAASVPQPAAAAPSAPAASVPVAPPRPPAPHPAPQTVPHSPLPPRPAAPPASAAPRPASPPPPAAPVQAAPPRGIQGFGRAVIAPPTASTTRAVAKPQPAPIRPPVVPGGIRPGLPLRPGMPPRPGMPLRPGMPPRPGFAPGRPDMGPRPGGFGRGPAAPGLPPSPPSPGAEKRRKDATKSTVTVKKDDAKKVASKKPRTKEVSALEEDVKVYLGTYQEDTYEDIPAETEEGASDQPVSKSAQRRAGKKTIKSDTGARVEIKKNAPTGPVFLSEGVTVKELSEKTGILAKDLMKSFLARGILATINHPVDPSLAVEIAKEFGIDAAVVSFEEDLELSRQQAAQEEAEKAEAAGAAASAGELLPRAPVVTVMGHVDHGKTSLLDAIRHADVAAGEAGGITQHIGAYRVEVKGRHIVFLDTPGHEAFTMMRARGAKATDIVVLVVAADDGVMPQTLEAIDHSRAAKVPMVVAINKIDKPEANPMRVKQALADKGVLVEEYGGEVVACEISAKKKLGIDNLLEMLALQADILELKASTEVPARGVVLEARREAGKGTLATVLVQAGTLRVGEFFFAGAAVGRVRAMLDDRGNRITEAGPATPVEVMGFEDLPNAGDSLQVVENEADARRVQTFRVQKEREEKMVKTTKLSLDSLFTRIEKGEAKELAIIVKADVHGSEEVLVQTLAKLSTDKVKVNVIHSGVGAITLNDVNLAQASEAIIIGFNVRPEKKAEELAGKEGVDIRLYSVIYTLTDEIKKAMAGLLESVKKEVAKGKAEVRATFKIPKIGTIAGCMVTEGVVPRAASVRLVRDSRVIYEGKIGSLKRVKDDASEVKSGFECGIGIAGYQDVKIGDVIEAFVTEEVAASLT